MHQKEGEAMPLNFSRTDYEIVGCIFQYLPGLDQIQDRINFVPIIKPFWQR